MQGFYDESGELQTGKVIALSRPYQQSTQGTLISNQYDPYTRIFSSSFLVNKKLQAKDAETSSLEEGAVTTIFMNKKLYFPEGYNFMINGGLGNTPVTGYSVQEMDE